MAELVCPNVFISYSHDSTEHADRVLALADALRDNGIDVVLDQYIHPAPAEGWTHWMDHQIDAADFVLLICTEVYRRRVMGHEKPGKGKGVRWEGTLIYNRIYNDEPSGTRFVPVLLDGAEPAHIPNPLQDHPRYSITTLDLTDPDFERLYRHLTNQPPTPAGELGQLKRLPPRPRQSSHEGQASRAAVEPAGPRPAGRTGTTPAAFFNRLRLWAALNVKRGTTLLALVLILLPVLHSLLPVLHSLLPVLHRLGFPVTRWMGFSLNPAAQWALLGAGVTLLIGSRIPAVERQVVKFLAPPSPVLRDIPHIFRGSLPYQVDDADRFFGARLTPISAGTESAASHCSCWRGNPGVASRRYFRRC